MRKNPFRMARISSPHSTKSQIPFAQLSTSKVRIITITTYCLVLIYTCLFIAAGTTGREMLFQATSEQMLEAYSHVPRPFGTIVANEVFSSGVIMSE